MKIYIGSGSEIQGTSVPVRWCLSKDELNKLNEARKEVFLLLLVVSDTGGERSETRYFIPIKQMMEYVNFYTPGKNKIFAMVAERKDREYFLHKYGIYYSNSLYNYYGKNLHPSYLKNYYDLYGIEVCELEVNVPKEVFAKEPPAWEKKWVNLFLGWELLNQCDYRKKQIFAYSFQLIFFLPILGSIELAVGLIISALLLFGTKGIGFRKIIRPFSESFSSIWDETKGSIFGRRFIPRLLPSIFLGSSVISWVICKILGSQIVIGTNAVTNAVIIGGVAVGAVVAVPGFIYLSYYGAVKAIDKIRNALVPVAKAEEERKKQKRSLAEAAEKERSRKLRERIEAEYALLACDGNLSAKTLPSAKRTVYLRYKDLKSRVCKSFAR